jgi:hypothetical protein
MIGEKIAVTLKIPVKIVDGANKRRTLARSPDNSNYAGSII